MTSLLLGWWLLLQSGPSAYIINPPYDFTYFEKSPVFLQAISFEPDVSFNWTLPDGSSQTGDLVEFTLGQTDAQVRMTPTDASGQSAAEDDRIFYVLKLENVATYPTITGLTAEPSTPRAGQTVEVHANGIIDADMDGPYTYHWFYLIDRRPVRATGETLTLQTPQDALPGQVLTVSLVVKDAAGNPSFPVVENLVIVDGNQPPDGRIIQPNGLDRLISVGETLTFEGSATDPEGEEITFAWRLNGTEVATTNPFHHTFNQVGTYIVQLVAKDIHGNEDPTPPAVRVRVQDTTPIPQTIIFHPVTSTRMFAGDQLLLNGQVSDNNASDFDLYWTLTAVPSGRIAQRLEGQLPGRITIPDPGLYQLRFHAQKGELQSAPSINNFRWIAVQPRDGSPPPRLDHTNGFSFVIANGETLDLRAAGEDPEGGTLQWLWTVNGTTSEEVRSSFRYTPNLADEAFTEGVATILVEAHALNQNGPANFPLTHTVYVYQDTQPPNPQLNDQDIGGTLFLPLGTTFTPTVNPRAPLTVSDYDYYWTGTWNDALLPAIQAQTYDLAPFQLTRTGVLTLQLSALTKGTAPRWTHGGLIHLHVYDPLARPTTSIIRPSVDLIRLEPGAQLRLEGLAADPNHVTSPAFGGGYQPIETNLTWRIQGAEGQVGSYQQNEALTVSFDQVGDYQIFLEAANTVGLSTREAAVLQVTVAEPTGDTSLEPNDTRDQAAQIGAGAYADLSVGPNDPIDWYRFDLEEAGAAVELELDLTATTGDVRLDVFFEENLVHGEQLTAGSRQPFSFVGGEAGAYFLRLESIDTPGKAAKMLSLTMGLSISNPRLIFGYPKTDTTDQTIITLTNPTNAATNVTVLARAQDGQIQGEAELTLPPNGHFEKAVDDLFTQFNTAATAWLQVRADANINGFAMTLGRDGETAVAETASVGPLNRLVVPHIAADTQSWFTRAAITNAGAASATTNFRAADGDWAVHAVTQSHQHALLDFQSFFGGDLPAGVSWGRFEEDDDKPALSGMEIFGVKGGSPRLAALNLTGDNMRNPGFVYQNRDIIFPHVAKDTAAFWTGIAFVNTSVSQTALRLIGYDDAGNRLAEQPMVLAAGEKRVGLAHDFFDDVDSGISWIHLQTDGPIHGYALFGNASGPPNRLAGFPAARGGSRELRFQKLLYQPGSYWTGIAVVNLSPTHSADLTYQAYSRDGDIVATATKTVGPYRKDVVLVENIFGAQLPQGAAWIRLTSTQPLAGFQLFGDVLGKFFAASQ